MIHFGARRPLRRRLGEHDDGTADPDDEEVEVTLEAETTDEGSKGSIPVDSGEDLSKLVGGRRRLEEKSGSYEKTFGNGGGCNG